jgi:GalNAc-alpha-(1->4)-GalNAc-alpha-(1->3)-diNAcBac-PP-undecaprenol alpha-1,4-N-acetyl-D-galactosaminyltransferase
MKIVHFISGLDRGGAQRVVVDLCREMASRHEVEIWVKCKKEYAYDVPPGVLVREMSPKGCVSTRSLIPRIVGMLRHGRPDFFVAHTNRNTVPAIVAGRIARVPVIAVEHTVAAGLASPLWRLARRLAYPFARRVVVLSSDQEDAYPGARTMVVPNPVSAPVHAGTTTPEVTARGLEIIYVGRLEYVKGVDRLIEACSRLSIPFHLTIVGDGSRLAELQRHARDSGIEGRVAFVGWVTEGLERYYRRAAVVAMTSRVEGFGLAVVEGMATGCIPVAYDVTGGLSDIIEDGQNGFLVEDGNAVLFAKRLEQLFRNQAMAEAISRKAVATAERYSPRRIVERWEREVFSETPSPSS